MACNGKCSNANQRERFKTMGNSSNKFKGTGHTLGDGKDKPAAAPAPPQAKPRSSSIAKSLIPTPKKTPTKAKPRTPEEQARAQQLLVQKREAAAAAAMQRTKAWDERVNKFKAKDQQERAAATQQQSALKWNETSSSSASSSLPPLDPAIARKQREAAEQLEKSGFNPYQATMANSTAARNAIDNMTITPRASPAPLDAAAKMAQSRTRLLEAMRGSNVRELEQAIANAQVFDVPELDEARDIYNVLIDQQEEEEEEEAPWDFSYIDQFVYAIATSSDTLETKRMAKSTLLTILGNLVQSPHEAKFRKIRLANKQIQERIAKPLGCLALLEAVGFREVLDEQQNELCMMVPDPNSVTKDQVEYARQACNAAIARLNELNLG